MSKPSESSLAGAGAAFGIKHLDAIGMNIDRIEGHSLVGRELDDRRVVSRQVRHRPPRPTLADSPR